MAVQSDRASEPLPDSALDHPLPMGTQTRPAVADALEPREVLLHRCIVTITPSRIEVRPPRSTLVMPFIGIALTSFLLAVLVVWADSLPFWSLPLILIFSVLILPLSGITLVYAVFGANIVADKAGHNVSVKQRFLGLGIGTTELVPFWKIREFLVEDVGRARMHPQHDDPAHDIAQWDLTLIKKSGKQVRIGGFSVSRDREEEGLDVVMDVAEAFAALSGAPIRGPIW